MPESPPGYSTDAGVNRDRDMKVRFRIKRFDPERAVHPCPRGIEVTKAIQDVKRALLGRLGSTS